MAYTKTNWVPRQGTNLNKFTKSAETPTSFLLTNTPDAITQAGTPFSVENMNKIEQGIFNAHQIAENNFNVLTSHADAVEGTGRDLRLVFAITSTDPAVYIPQIMAEIRRRCNNNGEIDNSGIPDFTGLMIGDYIDGLDLSAIPAENGGTAGQPWNGTYRNNRLVLSAFNPYKGVGDMEVTKNHVRFDFANVPLLKRMNSTDDNAGDYAASELRVFLDGANGDGTGSRTGVTTAAFLNALKARIGDYILPVRRLLSNKVSWVWGTYSLWIPSENEVIGANAFGEMNFGDGQKLHIPLYQKSYAYRIKLYNGARDWYFLNTPSSSSPPNYFCGVDNGGFAFHAVASAVGGCASAFCAA
jgi:hypothetical protein